MPSIKGVVRLVMEDIQSPVGNVAAAIVPYLQGCLLQKRQYFTGSRPRSDRHFSDLAPLFSLDIITNYL